MGDVKKWRPERAVINVWRQFIKSAAINLWRNLLNIYMVT